MLSGDMIVAIVTNAKQSATLSNMLAKHVECLAQDLLDAQIENLNLKTELEGIKNNAKFVK